MVVVSPYYSFPAEVLTDYLEEHDPRAAFRWESGSVILMTRNGHRRDRFHLIEDPKHRMDYTAYHYISDTILAQSCYIVLDDGEGGYAIKRDSAYCR